MNDSLKASVHLCVCVEVCVCTRARVCEGGGVYTREIKAQRKGVWSREKELSWSLAPGPEPPVPALCPTASVSYGEGHATGHPHVLVLEHRLSSKVWGRM